MRTSGAITAREQGTYLPVEAFHMHRHLDQQAYFFNNREVSDAERFPGVPAHATGGRLTLCPIDRQGERRGIRECSQPACGALKRKGRDERLALLASAIALYCRNPHRSHDEAAKSKPVNLDTRARKDGADG